MITSTIRTPAGNLKITQVDNTISACNWTLEKPSRKKQTPLIKKTKTQLLEYFKGDRHTFDIPLSFSGTSFQKSVWQALQNIPYGETRSYQDIAKQINNPLAVRAVGTANSKNPFSILIPCHRVICASGKLGGYTGGINRKILLLSLENLTV